MVALFLIAGIFGVVGSGGFGQRKDLEEVANDIERAVRFSSDEAALRNVIVRVHFILEAAPQQYMVEYGPNDNFVLPVPIIAPSDDLSERDREKLKKETTTLNRNFNKIREFQDKNKLIAEGVRLIGIGSEQNDFLQTDFHASIYLYPTGEKDSALIILGTDDEVVALSIDAFTQDINREYRRLEYEDIDEIEEAQNKLAAEIFTEWARP